MQRTEHNLVLFTAVFVLVSISDILLTLTDESVLHAATEGVPVIVR